MCAVSLCVLGERRKELKSPAVTGGAAGAYNRLVEANSSSAVVPPGGMEGIREEVNGKKKQQTGDGYCVSKQQYAMR